MIKPFNSLRTKFILWYIGSLLLLASYFFLAIHFYPQRYGIQIFILMFIILAFVGSFLIIQITQSLTKFTEKLKTITEKNLDERVQSFNGEDEIAKLAQTFNELLDRISASFKREKIFIGELAHELKTPLTTLKSRIEISLNKSRTQEEYRQELHESLIEINRMVSTLENVLNLAWSEADDAVLRTQTFLLSKLVAETVTFAKKLALQKQIQVKKLIKPNLYISGDRVHLQRAILNIIDNAIKYTLLKGRIKIRLFKQDKTAILVIADNGVGITNEDLPNVFDRFYRGSTATKFFGSGLGLAIAKSIIEKHHGTITVKSKVNKGTRFIIKLPLDKVP